MLWEVDISLAKILYLYKNLNMVDSSSRLLEKEWHTRLLIPRQRLIMLPPQLRPPRKLILGARSVHLALQPEDISSELILRAHLFRMRARYFAVECP